MSLGAYQTPRDAGTVPIHVQVIDLQPFSLDMVVPDYLPARDLTQRVARDAGLGAFWEDGTRRKFYLRVRGRLLTDEEKLRDFGVVPHELVHLLPQPPEGSGLEERPPEYPANKGYAGAGNLNVLGSMVVVLGWTAAWSVALSTWPSVILGLIPGVALSLLVTSFARHLWGGVGSQIRIPVTGLALFVSMLVLAGLFAWPLGADPADLAVALGTAFIGGAMGVLLGWLAWYGAVEPLPKVTHAEQKVGEASVTWPCGICGGAVTPDVKAECVYRCGRVFHVGCYQAKVAITDGASCAVCGFAPSALAPAS
jgi:uncharacterized ubiquitin-like protein YukD